MESMLLMVYPTFAGNGEPPVLLSLPTTFTSQQFLQFLAALTDALKKAQSGYDHTSMTIVVMEREPAGWVATANFLV